MKLDKMFLKECHLAGRQYYDVNEVWEYLKVGTPLTLMRDSDNRYDKNAVAVMFCNPAEKSSKRHILGYIPSGQNEEIALLLDMGWGEMFECLICKINPEAHYENQIHLAIRVKRNERKSAE